MPTSNAVPNAATSDKTPIDKTIKTGAEAASEKLSEKRRALGRGLESLLPGPRAVPPPAPATTAPAASPAAREDKAIGDKAENKKAEVKTSQQDETGETGRPAPALVPVAGVPGIVDELHASGHAADGGGVFELALDQIGQNPHQTRTEFDPQALTELAGSIQTQGILQPIVVRPVGARAAGADGAESPESAVSSESPESNERYILILGERRFRASKLAGKTTIPAIVKRVSEQQAAEMTLVENLQRQDLDCLDQAAAFLNLSTQFKLTQEEIGKRVGVSREQVSNYLRLLRLPIEVQAALRKKELTYSHARLLLSLDESQITKVARTAIEKKMSVALLTEMVMDLNTPPGFPPEQQLRSGRWIDPNVRAEQRAIETTLGMRVRIRDRKGKGTITIEYGTLNDFDTVVRRLKGK